MKNNSKMIKSGDEIESWMNPKKLTKSQKLLKIKRVAKSLQTQKEILENKKSGNKNLENTGSNIANSEIENLENVENNLRNSQNLKTKKSDEKEKLEIISEQIPAQINELTNQSEINQSENLEKNQISNSVLSSETQNYHIPVLISKVADILLPKTTEITNSKNLEIEDKTKKEFETNLQTNSKIELNIKNNEEKVEIETTKLRIFDGTLGGFGYVNFLNNQAENWNKSCNLVNNTNEIDKVSDILQSNFVNKKTQTETEKIEKITTEIPNPISQKVENTENTENKNKLELQFWGSDLDESVIEKAQKISNLQASYGNFANCISEFENNFFDAIILDLGFSTNQLEISGRGFSHQKLDEILDLRYSTQMAQTASEKLGKVREIRYLSHILYSLSGEEFSSRIAANIYNLVQITKKQITKKDTFELTVGQIVECVIAAIPVQFCTKKNQILSRVWQALRIWTNDEFDSLQKFLTNSVDKLKVGGKLMIVSFHSLEDKIVTNFMRKIEKPQTDSFGKKTQNYRLLTKKSIKPEASEVLKNSASRSAILRVLERLV